MQKAETAYSNSSYEEALTYVEQALDLQGDSAEALTLYAQILDKLGDTGKAAEVLEQVIGDNPNYEAAYGILIRVYSDLGHPRENPGTAGCLRQYFYQGKIQQLYLRGSFLQPGGRYI